MDIINEMKIYEVRVFAKRKISNADLGCSQNHTFEILDSNVNVMNWCMPCIIKL